MTIHPEMSAAFPSKLSEGAEKLRERLEGIPARYVSSPNLFLAPVIASAIVSELGITPEMVGILRPNSGGRLEDIAVALSTLLEVAGK